MSGNIACIAAIILGIDAGWQPLPDGGMLYIIQIEPELLEVLRSGEPIQSDFPSSVKDVRAFRIVVGTAELPRQLPPEQSDPPAATADPPPPDPFLPGAAAETNRPPGAESPGTPNVIQPPPDSKRIDAQQAGYLQRPSAQRDGESKSPSDRDPAQKRFEQEPPAKPWGALTVTLFTLFGSLGANFYLGWITYNTRSRYRSLAEDTSRAEME